MGKKTLDAVEILKRRTLKNPRVRALYEAEKLNLQVALTIRRARETAGLTQGELARRVGTTQSVISRLEDADYEGHTFRILERIATALGQQVVIDLRPESQRAA